MRDAFRELVGGTNTIGALEGCVDRRSGGKSRSAEADAWQLVDSVAAADYGVAEDVVVEAGARQNSGVDIRNQAVGSAVEPCKLDSALLLCRGIDDVRVEGVHVVMFFGERTVELIAQPEIDGELGRQSVVVLDITGEEVQIHVEDGVRRGDICGRRQTE